MSQSVIESVQLVGVSVEESLSQRGIESECPPVSRLVIQLLSQQIGQ